MKRTKLFTGFTLTIGLIILAVTGCKKNNDGGSGGNGISATVGGTAWQSQNVQGIRYGGYIVLAGTYGKSGDTSMITIQIHDSVKVNESDPFEITDVTYTKTDGTLYSSDFYPGHGTLTLTSRDTAARKMSGTFSGVLYNANNYGVDQCQNRQRAFQFHLFRILTSA